MRRTPSNSSTEPVGGRTAETASESGVYLCGRLMGMHMDLAEPGRRRLGSLLLAAGLVSERDLGEALAEQERSGRRLGEVLIGRGIVSAAAVANALAEQHGSFLKTEHGFGTGLGALMGRVGAPEEAAAPKAPPLSPVPSMTETDTDGVQEEENESPDSEHLLFVPTHQGYLLVERSGAAPALGEVVELPETPGARLTVAKLASSPLPHDSRICVYLNNL